MKVRLHHQVCTARLVPVSELVHQVGSSLGSLHTAALKSFKSADT
jgi:hypothetical protein